MAQDFGVVLQRRAHVGVWTVADVNPDVVVAEHAAADRHRVRAIVADCRQVAAGEIIREGGARDRDGGGRRAAAHHGEAVAIGGRPDGAAGDRQVGECAAGRRQPDVVCDRVADRGIGDRAVTEQLVEAHASLGAARRIAVALDETADQGEIGHVIAKDAAAEVVPHVHEAQRDILSAGQGNPIATHSLNGSTRARRARAGHRETAGGVGEHDAVGGVAGGHAGESRRGIAVIEVDSRAADIGDAHVEYAQIAECVTDQGRAAGIAQVETAQRVALSQRQVVGVVRDERPHAAGRRQIITAGRRRQTGNGAQTRRRALTDQLLIVEQRQRAGVVRRCLPVEEDVVARIVGGAAVEIGDGVERRTEPAIAVGRLRIVDEPDHAAHGDRDGHIGATLTGRWNAIIADLVLEAGIAFETGTGVVAETTVRVHRDVGVIAGRADPLRGQGRGAVGVARSGEQRARAQGATDITGHGEGTGRNGDGRRIVHRRHRDRQIEGVGIRRAVVDPDRDRQRTVEVEGGRDGVAGAGVIRAVADRERESRGIGVVRVSHQEIGERDGPRGILQCADRVLAGNGRRIVHGGDGDTDGGRGGGIGPVADGEGKAVGAADIGARGIGQIGRGSIQDTVARPCPDSEV